MNSASLQEIAEKAIRLEDAHRLQKSLNLLQQTITNVGSSPGDAAHQSAFSEAFKTFKHNISKAQDEFTPGDMERLQEILMDDEFSIELVSKIEDAINENPATPAVAAEIISKISSDRQAAISNLRELLARLNYFGIGSYENDEDQGQVGFKIPRDIFNNDLDGLIHEFSFIKNFVRMVSEAELGHVDEIEVGELSTSDPVIWLIVAFAVAKGIASVTTWSLDTWKKVEDIRHVRAQTAQLNAFSDKEISSLFDKKIQGIIETEVKAKVEDLTADILDKARKNELQNGLGLMLKQFLARIERGLTVDVKYLPTAQNEEAEENDAVAQRRAEAQHIASTLIFPKPSGEPLLRIEAANDTGE